MLPFLQPYHMMYYKGRFAGEAGQDGSRQEGLERDILWTVSTVGDGGQPQGGFPWKIY